MEYKDLKKLKAELERIKNYFDDEGETMSDYLANHKNSSCDKYGNGFNLDHRFSATKSHTVSFDSWKGYFGDSGCSTILNIRFGDLFWKSFDKYINNHKRDIFQFISKCYEKELGEGLDSLIKEKEEIDNIINVIKRRVSQNE